MSREISRQSLLQFVALGCAIVVHFGTFIMSEVISISLFVVYFYFVNFHNKVFLLSKYTCVLLSSPLILSSVLCFISLDYIVHI